jgi:simple sugar transport system permease protein
MTTATAQQRVTTTSVTRSRITGLLLLATGLVMFVLFGMNLEPGQQATFGLNPGYVSQAIPIPDLVLPVQTTMYVLILITLFLGGWQLARGFRSTGLVIGIVAFCFIVAFLLWATGGKSFNLVGMLSSSLVRATPIALAALCGVISERCAVINIGIEGIMLI